MSWFVIDGMVRVEFRVAVYASPKMRTRKMSLFITSTCANIDAKVEVITSH